MGELGLYLALTGNVMNGLDSMYAGIGTHFIENENIGLVYDKIINKSNYNEEFINKLLNENSKVFLENDTVKHELIKSESLI